MSNERSTCPNPKWWMLTIAQAQFTPYLPESCCYIKGQLELAESGFLHWQVVVCFNLKSRLSAVRKVFGEHHAEPTRSSAALEYVWKEDTSVAGTRFELGKIPFNRSKASDWDKIYALARSGDLEHNDIPRDVLIRSYHSLRAIAKDHCRPTMRQVQEVNVYWGTTGAGKSHRAFIEAGEEFYIKSSTTKWWDGYKGESNIILDEFRGIIDITHLLLWLDKFPCAVEIKGSQVALKSAKWWIMSNIDPELWYPTVNLQTREALFRRFTNVVYFNKAFTD